MPYNASKPFEIKNKLHHWNQRDELPHPRLISTIYHVKWPKEMAEIRGLRKVLITPEWNKIERWALRRSKEDTFFYQMVN
jgi:hypothetical protein